MENSLKFLTRKGIKISVFCIFSSFAKLSCEFRIFNNVARNFSNKE